MVFLSRVTALTIGPANVALPASLINENERGELTITTYVQIGSNFLTKESLDFAIMVLISCMTSGM